MKKLMPLILLIIIVPQVAFASWWNPFSWNWKALFFTPKENPIEEIKSKEVEESVSKIGEKENVSEEVLLNQKETLTPDPNPISKSSPKSSVVQSMAAPSTLAEPVRKFLIENVKSEVTENLATITWTTSIPAQSQLILDSGKGKGYESINGIGISHKVSVADPVSSVEYNYKIIARANDGETIDYYGSFIGNRKFSAGSTINNDCRVIYVKDSLGKPAVGMEIEISGTFGNSNVAIGKFQEKTDKYGEVELEKYCKTSPLKLIITGYGFETRLTIQNGTAVIADTVWNN